MERLQASRAEAVNSDDLRAIRDETGVPYMSLYGLRIQIRQLKKSKIPWPVVLKVFESIHPLLMKNLTVHPSGRLALKNRSMIWARGRGWVRR